MAYSNLNRRSIIPSRPPPTPSIDTSKLTASFTAKDKKTSNEKILLRYDQLLAADTPNIRDSLRGLKDQPDLNDIQGDIFYIFPKIAEHYLFFTIQDVTKFRTNLQSFRPSNCNDVTDVLHEIDLAKAEAEKTGKPVKLVESVLTELAFSRKGLHVLGVKENIQDARFDKGQMVSDRKDLGDQGKWEDAFADTKDPIHGVFKIATSSSTDATKDVETKFKNSITIKHRERGNVLPNRAEHFGFRDGVSQPALRKLVEANPGQMEVDSGVILMGYTGDPVFDNKKLPVTFKRPAWTKGGSMMVFRKLEQDVEGFNKYLEKNQKKWSDFVPSGTTLSDKEGREYFGARMLGRWKSGAPIQLAPYKDDKALANDNQRNNKFDFTVDGELSAKYCPFTAHIRKMSPRNLEGIVAKKDLEAASIIRAGIPYGPKWTPETKDKTRGLLFACYQSSIDNGFMQTTRFGGDNYFPPTSSLKDKYYGQDPIIGSLDDAAIQAHPKPEDQPEFFVTSRGGEYFFVPPVSTINKWATESHPPALDMLFLQDSTGSQQPYINQAKVAIDGIMTTLAKSGTWDKKDLRFGLIAFRDHPPQDSTFVTKTHPFTSDVSQMETNLSNLTASGGGDGPEAQTAALNEAVNADWRDDAVKIVVLITDAPPHGIGEVGDGFPAGDPEQKDPIRLATRMLNLGITLFVVACEPTLSNSYDRAHDFYTSLTQRTHGRMIGLSQVSALTSHIALHAVSAAKTEQIINQNENEIVQNAFILNQNIDQVIDNLYAKLKEQNTHIDTGFADNIYLTSPEGSENQKLWNNATDLAGAKDKIKPVTGQRIKAKYRQGGAIQSIELRKTLISYNQVEEIVKKVVGRFSDDV